MSDVTIRTLGAQPTLVVRGKVAVVDMPKWLVRSYAAVERRAADAGAQLAGPPFAKYRPLDSEFRAFEVEAGFPVADETEGEGEVEGSMLPAGPAAAVWHIGPYDAMTTTYDALMAFLAQHHAEALGAPWEVYYSDPTTQPDPTTWRTEIIQPFLA